MVALSRNNSRDHLQTTEEDEMRVQSIYPEELPAFSAPLGEAEYAVVDVRQPGEYREGHIPGSRLLPLPEIEHRLDELRSTPNLVFYCRSGARSQAAATLAQEALPPETRILNLVGGFLAWEGRPLADMPRLDVFWQNPDQSQFLDMPRALLRAMELEKAAQRFYEAAAARTRSPELTKTLNTLTKVEQAHARIVFHRLQQADPTYAQWDFAESFAQMRGDILEGGLSLDEAIAVLDRTADRSTSAASSQETLDQSFCLGVTELALQIELMAYDLYKNLAMSHAQAELKPIFLELAKDELNHQRLLARLLPECVA